MQRGNPITEWSIEREHHPCGHDSTTLFMVNPSSAGVTEFLVSMLRKSNTNVVTDIAGLEHSPNDSSISIKIGQHEC